MNTQIQTSNEIIHEPKPFNPRSLELLSAASDQPGSLHLSIEKVGDEQCVVARIVDLTSDMKAVFEAGAGETDDEDLQRDWTSWSNEVGGADIEIQAVRAGKTGRQKEIQVAFFGIHNETELMQAVAELNDTRREDGVEAEEGLPGKIAYLPDNILVATREMRANSMDEILENKAAQDTAVAAGTLALDGLLSKAIIDAEREPATL